MMIQKEFYIERRFLNLPVKNDAPKSLIAVRIGDETITEFRIELTQEEPDFWVFFDASRFYGKWLRFSVEASDHGNPASLLETIVPGDDVITETGELIRPLHPPESRIRHISRDPKLFWYEPTQKWIMIVYEQDTYEAYDGKSCTFAVYQYSPRGLPLLQAVR